MKIAHRAGAKWKDALLVFFASWGMAIVSASLFIYAGSVFAFILLAAYAFGQQIVSILVPTLMVLLRGTPRSRALILAFFINITFLVIAVNFTPHP